VAIALRDISDAVLSHALASGYVSRAYAHEPKSAPGEGVTAAVWVQSLQPVPQHSGLAVTSVRVELSVRLLVPMLSEPQDGIDPALISAADALMRAYTGDFELGGEVAFVDLLGAYGPPLQGEAGYYSQDGQLYRGFVITLPFILNDLWSQSG
jgi:hypothetical protein